MTEADILRSIREDPEEFSVLFKEHYAPIFGYIFRRTGDFDQSADIASETFLKAFLHISRFSYRGIPIKVWLYRIATNEVNLYYRSQRRKSSLFDRLDEKSRAELSEPLSHDREILEAEMTRHQEYQTVLSALKKLPPKYQDVISLRYFEGKDNREIMDILGLKEGTLKSLLSRGISRLKDACADSQNNPEQNG